MTIEIIHDVAEMGSKHSTCGQTCCRLHFEARLVVICIYNHIFVFALDPSSCLIMKLYCIYQHKGILPCSERATLRRGNRVMKVKERNLFQKVFTKFTKQMTNV